jgi:hypothetical protein
VHNCPGPQRPPTKGFIDRPPWTTRTVLDPSSVASVTAVYVGISLDDFVKCHTVLCLQEWRLSVQLQWDLELLLDDPAGERNDRKLY